MQMSAELEAAFSEQVDGESAASEDLGRLRRTGDDGSALLVPDSEPGSRPPESR